MSFNLYKADSLHYKRLKQSEIYGQEFAVSIFSSAELVMVSARACGNNCRWREQGYRCGWSFTSEFQVLRSRCLERAVRPWSRCLVIITRLSSTLIDPFGFHVLWLWWFPCSDLMLFINTCVSGSAAVKLAGSPRELVSHLYFLSCHGFHPNASSWPPQCRSTSLTEWWNNSFHTIGGLSQTLTVAPSDLNCCSVSPFLFFFVPSVLIKSDLWFANTQAQFSGQEKEKWGCLNGNCDQDHFAGYLGNENKKSRQWHILISCVQIKVSVSRCRQIPRRFLMRALWHFSVVLYK